MPSHNVLPLLLTGLIFHLVFIYTVFDCYFTSPVVNGMRHYSLSLSGVDATVSRTPGTANTTVPPLADRLVLIVGDGLRADMLFGLGAFKKHVASLTKEQEEGTVAPYLRNIILERGAYGISHTRVPTESRPGHVALIGGMYEDVSAVTKVDFDSVFNQSSHTFSFGSPDILPMFSRGAEPPEKVRTWMYDEVDEDFSKDATVLDDWVLVHLRDLLNNATVDARLDSDMRQPKVVFFLHLLGLDTTGHSYRPHSREYMNAITNVDSIVSAAEELIEDFYGHDGRTAYIFTADHGMSVVGNHGDGHPDNTRTPLVAWGSGFRKPLRASPDETPAATLDTLFPPPFPPHDAYSSPWNLSHLVRTDVEQADVSALMAAVLGVSWPVHGVGVLPDVKLRPGVQGGYLDVGDGLQGEERICRAAQVNAQVITEQYRVKHELKRRYTIFYKPFSPLSSSHVQDDPLTLRLATLDTLIKSEQYSSARQEAFKLIEDGLEGLRYLHTYDRLLLRAIVCFAYTGWAAYASLYIFRPASSPTKQSTSSKGSLVAALGVLATFWSIFAIQRSPWTYFVYVAFPLYFWYEVSKTITATPALISWIKSMTIPALAIVIVKAVVVFGVLQAMVIAYTHRFIWSAGFVATGLFWPAYAFYMSPRTVALKPVDRKVIIAWVASSLITAVFPILDLNRKESLSTILLGGTSMLAFGAAATSAIAKSGSRELIKGFSYQLLLVGVSMAITSSSVVSLQARNGLPILNQVAGWIVLVLASTCPLLLPANAPLGNQTANIKILTLFLSFAPLFILLSISVEGFFYLSYCMTLVLWIEVEALNRNITEGSIFASKKVSSDGLYKFQADDLRIALFFLFFVQVGFFGTGNVASISSFYLEPVFRLVVVFRPFLMAALLILKIVAPYILLSACFATLNAKLRLPPFSLFLVSLALTDGMTMTFFFKVTDTGSWLEIGQSISFFCITSLLLVWSAGICAAGEAMMASAFMSPGDASSTVKKAPKQE